MSQRKKTATNTVTFLIHMCNIMVKAHVTDITITGNFSTLMFFAVRFVQHT